MCIHGKLLQLCLTLWEPMDSCDHQPPLPMGFSRQEHWSGLPCPPPEDLPDPGIEPTSLTSPALAGGVFTTSAAWEAHLVHILTHVTGSFLSFSEVSPRVLSPAETENCSFSRVPRWDADCGSFCASSPLPITTSLHIFVVQLLSHV